tara:strand:+ start:1334 stop:1690 length:357 start_codon:yes stop_codon:yes gene_type:complete
VYQLKKIHQETQVLQLPHHKQIILLVLVDQPHMLQVKIQLQRLILLRLGLLVEVQLHHGKLVIVPQQHLILQLLSQPRGQQVKVLLNKQQDQHQLLALQELVGQLVELPRLIPQQPLQ